MQRSVTELTPKSLSPSDIPLSPPPPLLQDSKESRQILAEKLQDLNNLREEESVGVSINANSGGGGDKKEKGGGGGGGGGGEKAMSEKEKEKERERQKSENQKSSRFRPEMTIRGRSETTAARPMKVSQLFGDKDKKKQPAKLEG